MLAMRQEEERRLKALEAVQKKLGMQVPMGVPVAAAAPGATASGGAGGTAGGAATGSGSAGGAAVAAFEDDGRDVGGRCALEVFAGRLGFNGEVDVGCSPVACLPGVSDIHKLLVPSCTCRSRRARQKVNYAFNEFDETLRSGACVAGRLARCGLLGALQLRDA